MSADADRPQASHRPGRRRPGLAPAKTLRRGLTMACPVCGQRGQFHRWFTIAESCRRCGLRFERLQGHWLGSIALNTTFSFFVMLVVLTGSLIATYPEFGVTRLLIINLPMAIVAPIFFLPMAKTLWTAVDLLARPLADGEVAPEFAPVHVDG